MRNKMNQKLHALLALAALCLTAGGALAEQCNAQANRYVVSGDYASNYDRRSSTGAVRLVRGGQ